MWKYTVGLAGHMNAVLMPFLPSFDLLDQLLRETTLKHRTRYPVMAFREYGTKCKQ